MFQKCRCRLISCSEYLGQANNTIWLLSRFAYGGGSGYHLECSLSCRLGPGSDPAGCAACHAHPCGRILHTNPISWRWACADRRGTCYDVDYYFRRSADRTVTSARGGPTDVHGGVRAAAAQQGGAATGGHGPLAATQSATGGVDPQKYDHPALARGSRGVR